MNHKMNFVLYTRLDLRLFDNTQTTLLNTPGNDLSPVNKDFFKTRVLDNAKPNLIHAQFGDQYNIPARNGKVIEFRRYSKLNAALTALTEGVTPSGDKLNVTNIIATVAQYGNYIEISDVLELVALDPELERAAILLGDQAGDTKDKLVREVLHSGTNVMYAPKESGTEVLLRENITSDCVLDVKTIFKAAAALKRVNAPKINGSYVGIVHTDISSDLMSSSQWIDISKYSHAEKIFEGEIGKLAGIRFVETSNAKITANAGSGGISVYGTLFLGANAFGVTSIEGGGLEFIVKQLGSGNDPLNQRATVGWKCLHVSEILTGENLLRVEHACATNPMAASN